MMHVDSKEKDNLARDRFDQSPQPIYPNFEPVKKGGKPTRQILGNIGWGTDNPKLRNEGSPVGNLNESLDYKPDRNHINYFDKSRTQHFNDLTGSFTNNGDR